MNNSDPFAPARRGLDNEDVDLLGMSDADEYTDATNDSMMAADHAEPYIAASDPPVVPGGRDGIEVADGFAPSDENALPSSIVPDDDEITQRVKTMLRDDAATSALNLDVETIDTVVYLKGTVTSIDDAEQATDVASRVQGVTDVIDNTVIA